MATDATLPTCARHPDRETRLACPRCGRAVCDLCLSVTDDAPGCPTCRAEADPPDVVSSVSSAPVRRPPQRTAPVTVTLLVVFVAVYLVGTQSGTLAARIVNNGAQINALVMRGEWWRVLSATLLHGGITHLLFNGYALYVLGAQLERAVGSAAFAALYTASALAGGIAFLLMAPNQDAVGASGAIFGLFGAWFAAFWVNRDTPQGRAGVSQFAVLLLINLALPLFIPGIGWQAHLGGLLAGAVIGLGWARVSRRAAGVTPAERVTLPLAVGGALLAVLLWYTWP
jgi:membrane associated rhomboid family serine protease